MSGDLLSNLPDGVRQVLGAPPVTEKKLLELSVAWTGLSPRHARLADAVRLFVITWDPLERIAPRPDGFTTVNADASGLELVIYVPCWVFAHSAADWGGTLAAVLGAMAGSVVVTGATHEPSLRSGSYPDLVTAGAVPDLLSDMSAGAALGPPHIRLVSRGWEDIGLGAITDVVQHAFGLVDLDRSPVELVAGSHPGCPACAGRRFDFPGDLAEARSRMCPDHRREAEAVINQRLARANASNPDGWGALSDATLRLERPHLPNGLANKLAGADEAMYVIPEPDELAERAEFVIEAAGWFPGPPMILPSRSARNPTWRPSCPTGWSISFSTSAGPAWGPRRPRWVTPSAASIPTAGPSSTAMSRSRWPRPVSPTRPEPGSWRT